MKDPTLAVSLQNAEKKYDQFYIRDVPLHQEIQRRLDDIAERERREESGRLLESFARGRVATASR